jgi:para-aminobenzoate synthetase / 4-amino-4-deoxychorismate lyase
VVVDQQRPHRQTTDTYAVNPPAPPDPSRGIFETLLIAGGRPVEVVAHLGRLSASVREVFGAELPAAVATDAVKASAGIELGKLRIEVTPGEDGGLRHRIEATPIDRDAFFPDWERGEALRSVGAEGWSGAHKWADRRWLEDAEQQLGPEVPLLVDADGQVLEAGRANLFIVRDGALATPPVDGRILPGTARAATLGIAADLGIEAVERPLRLEELREADEVFLTSSVRGLRPARWLDGAELHRGELVERLAAELRQRWLGTRVER